VITYDELAKKHYILQVKRVDPFKADKPFTPFEGFYIECGEGWCDLLDKLCTDIEKELDKDPELKKDFKIAQIKEKFGSLRFYTYSYTEEIDKLIDEAQSKSEVTCETCGQPGKTHSISGWLTTLCPKCALPSYRKWSVDVIESIADTKKQIKELEAKTNLTSEERKECDEAYTWLKRCQEQLIEIDKNIKELGG